MKNVQGLIEEFTQQLTEALREQMREEFNRALGFESSKGSVPPKKAHKAAAPQAKDGRLRRSPEVIAKTANAIHAHLRAHKNGVRMEQISAALKIPTKDLVLPMNTLLTENKVRTTGQRRATNYFLR
jgi:hypothetical protein